MTKPAKGREPEQLGLWGSTVELSQNGSESAPAQVVPTRSAAKPAEHQALWDIDDLAAYLGVPMQTIYAWRTTGYGPRGIRIGKHLRWRATTVVTWTLELEQGQ